MQAMYISLKFLVATLENVKKEHITLILMKYFI